MKIAKLLLLSVSVILFSCGDDDDPKPDSSGLVGTWKVTELDYSGTSVTSAAGISIETEFTGTGKNMNMLTTFNDNPKTISNEGSYTIVLTSTIMGQSTTQEITLNEVASEGTWSVNGNILTVTTPDGPQDLTIVEQTSTTLKLKIDTVENESEQGVTVTTNISVNYTFKKQ